MKNIDFQALFESTPGLYLILLPDLTIVSVSDSYLDATMTTREGIIGHGLFDIFPDNPDDPTADGVSNLHFSLNKVLEKKEQDIMNIQKYDIRRPDGSFEVRFWSPLNKPVMNDKNEVVYIIHSVVDVTNQKKSENELIETNSFLDTILENIPNMLFVKDAKELKFVRLNAAGEALIGYSREDLIGKNDYDFFPQEQADFFTFKDKEVLMKGELLDIPEEKISTKSGDKWLHTKKIPVNDHDGNPLYLLGISEDITQKKESSEEIIEVNARLENANRELEAFSYSVSHDLKAPLRSLQGFSKVLLENYQGKFDAEADRWLQYIEKNASRMGELIDDILNFSKVSRTDLKIEQVNMKHLVKEVFDLEKNNYSDKKISFELEDIPNTKGDTTMLKLMWQNLISNALKYSSKNHSIRIKIAAENNKGFTVYSIRDNGVGFDEKYKEKLFGVFQRLHSNDEFDGTGVGLAIVNRIIQKHNGWIKALGEIGKGAEFTFALPT